MEEEVIGKAYDGRLMRRLLTYMRPYKATIVLSLVFLLVDSMLQIAGPLLTKLAIDRYLVPNPTRQTGPLEPYLSAEPWTGLDTDLGPLSAFAAGRASSPNSARRTSCSGPARTPCSICAAQLMAHLQKLDISFFDRNPVGRLVTRVTTDVDVLNDLFTSGLVTIIGDLLMLGFIVAGHAPNEPRHDRLHACCYAVRHPRHQHVPPLRLAELPAHPRGHRAHQYATCRNTSTASPCCSSSIAKQRAGKSSRQINRDHMDAFKDSITAYGWFYPVVEFFSMLALALLLAYGGFRIRGGALSLGVAGRVLPIRNALLPADSGSQRKVQHPARRHGRLGTHFQTAGHAAGTLSRPRCPQPVASDAACHRIRPRLVRLQG